jgi:site-specific DNA-methyltransferase (adenine-specific)
MQIQPNQFICADNMEVLREIPDGFFDLCLTDPPYGIGMDVQMQKIAGTQYGVGAAPRRDYGKTNWDKAPSQQFFEEIRRVSKQQIVWGGNYFTAFLPASRGWLMWDKQTNGFWGDGELAWSSFDSAIRLFRFMWNGMLQGNMAAKEERVHPTQKPVPLFVWCILNCSKPGDLIFDPFCGSGTTALACHKTGRRFVCIDREPKYIKIAQQRYADLIAQQNLFGNQDARAGQGKCPDTACNSGRDAMPLDFFEGVQ